MTFHISLSEIWLFIFHSGTPVKYAIYSTHISLYFINCYIINKYMYGHACDFPHIHSLLQWSHMLLFFMAWMWPMFCQSLNYLSSVLILKLSLCWKSTIKESVNDCPFALAIASTSKTNKRDLEELREEYEAHRKSAREKYEQAVVKHHNEMQKLKGKW